MILTITLNPSIDRKYVINGFEKGRLFRTDRMEYTPGGKGLNVTKVIKSFNEPVRATGFLGGVNGKYIEEKLNNIGISHDFVSIQGETRSCLAILSDDNSQTEILEAGPYIFVHETMKFYELYKNMIKEFEIICASGSLPQGLPPGTYKDLILIANEQNKKFLLDTSGEALKHGIEASPFLVKPNRDELENLAGYSMTSEEDIIRAAKDIMEKGVKLVAVSLGEEGAMAFYAGYSYKVKAPSIKVLNPVGSGDSMIAGFAVSLSRDYDIEDALRTAVACGTANAMETETGKVNMVNVKKIIDEIKIKKRRI